MKVRAEKTAQYTIRGIPPRSINGSAKRAAQLKQSLNQVIVDELTRATVGRPRRSDFSDVVGRWTPDRKFDEALAAQRKIDWAKWK